MRKSALFLLVSSLATSASAWAAPHVETFPVPKRGELQLSVPEGWVSELTQPPGEVPPTISLKPKVGQPFEVIITPYWRKEGDGTVYESALREQTQSAAAQAQSQAVEKTLTLKDLTGTEGHGYYFTATDRAPKPGEYKYLAQGMLRLGNLGLAFTVLTNDGQADVLAEALRVVSTAKHE